MVYKAFGFSFEDENQKASIRSPVDPNREGSLDVTSVDAFGTPMAFSMDLDGIASSENRLIEKYREMSQMTEVARAIEEIVSEMIVTDPERETVEINLESLELSDAVKSKIAEGFDHVLRLLHFRSKGYDIARRWYIDGRLNYHNIIDEKNPKKGIVELRYMDPRKVKKVREVINPRGSFTYNDTNFTQKKYLEYFIYNESGVETAGGSKSNQSASSGQGTTAGIQNGLRIAKEAITFVNSGVMDAKSNMIVSHLHNAIRPANNLRLMEDSLVIYRLARAPERRIFYVDVGNLPKGRSEQYMQQIMSKYKNKLVYDATTGEVRDDRRHLAMTEDYWIPRREGSTGTEIDTLPGGENLGVLDDVEYFKRKLMESLNVPMSRLSQEPSMFSKGTEITRDELRFARFVERLRSRFSELFDDILGKHLVLTGVMSWEFWEKIKDDVRYDFMVDNYFAEAKNLEIQQLRMQAVNDAQPFVGSLFSRNYIWKNLLRMTDEDIKIMKKELAEDIKENPDLDPTEKDAPPANEDVDFADESTDYITESEEELARSMSEFFKSMTAQPQVKPDNISE